MRAAASATPGPSCAAGCTCCVSRHRWQAARCYWPAHGTAQITAVAVYSANLSALFGTSALYYRGTWECPSRPAGQNRGVSVQVETICSTPLRSQVRRFESFWGHTADLFPSSRPASADRTLPVGSKLPQGDDHLTISAPFFAGCVVPSPAGFTAGPAAETGCVRAELVLGRFPRPGHEGRGGGQGLAGAAQLDAAGQCPAPVDETEQAEQDRQGDRAEAGAGAQHHAERDRDQPPKMNIARVPPGSPTWKAAENVRLRIPLPADPARSTPACARAVVTAQPAPLAG
jgi:hypothetical protein